MHTPQALIKPPHRVLDYRTAVTGITAKDFEVGPECELCSCVWCWVLLVLGMAL